MKFVLPLLFAGGCFIALYLFFRYSKVDKVPTVSILTYPIGDYDPKRPVIDTPQPGNQKMLGADQCAFSAALRGKPLKEAQKIIENHLNKTSSSTSGCDIDCDNVFIEELYESYLVKFMLEDEKLQSKLIDIYKKIYEGMRKKLGEDVYRDVIQYWEEQNPGDAGIFNVNQRFRNWTNNKQMLKFSNGNSVNPFMIRQLTGVSDFDPTTLLLSADFLKKLTSALPQDFSEMRDYMFNNILKRARGYRTNSKNRIVPGSNKKDKILLKERQIGITDFDLDDLILQPRNSYYKPIPFVHPGRSQCATVPLQGMYEHEAERLNIPIKCGISGSTNFWIWTALFSGVNLTLEETRLFLLSAFIVLNADGGHSMMEVLSSATMSSIFWKDYLRLSKDRTLEKYIVGSNFAKNMYEITKGINPLGKRAVLTIDRDQVGNDMFNTRNIFMGYDDLKTVTPAEAQLRMKVESYFLQENNRALLPFGEYTAFLDQIPEISSSREKTVQKLKEYVRKYC
jgi:hypothetical protein